MARSILDYSVRRLSLGSAIVRVSLPFRLVTLIAFLQSEFRSCSILPFAEKRSLTFRPIKAFEEYFLREYKLRLMSFTTRLSPVDLYGLLVVWDIGDYRRIVLTNRNDFVGRYGYTQTHAVIYAVPITARDEYRKVS